MIKREVLEVAKVSVVAFALFEKFIRYVEVREDGYLFVVSSNDGDMRLIYKNLDDAIEDLNGPHVMNQRQTAKF